MILDMAYTAPLVLAYEAHRMAAHTCRMAALEPPDGMVAAIDRAAIKCGDAGGPRRFLWTALDHAEAGRTDRAVTWLIRQADYHDTRAAQYDRIIQTPRASR